MAGKVLVVKGGTLIDGTGRPPVENAVVMIEGGRFKAVGKAGPGPVPEEAEVIDARGLTIMPGFIDGHAHLEDFHGELYLHLGITTVFTIQIFQDGPWTSAQKRGTELGKIRGPRIWMSGRAIGGTRAMPEGARRPHQPRQHHRHHAGGGARRRAQEKRAGLRQDQAQRVFATRPGESRRRRRRIASVCGSPPTAWTASGPRPMPASMPSSISGRWEHLHSLSAGAREVAHRPAGRPDRSGNRQFGYYQTENYRPIIDAMVQSQTAWTPTLAKIVRPLSSYAERFRAEGKRDPRRSEERFAGVGARGHGQCLQQAVQALHAGRARAAPRSAMEKPMNSSGASSRPAACSRKAPIRRAAWRRC